MSSSTQRQKTADPSAAKRSVPSHKVAGGRQSIRSILRKKKVASPMIGGVRISKHRQMYGNNAGPSASVLNTYHDSLQKFTRSVGRTSAQEKRQTTAGEMQIRQDLALSSLSSSEQRFRNKRPRGGWTPEAPTERSLCSQKNQCDAADPIPRQKMPAARAYRTLRPLPSKKTLRCQNSQKSIRQWQLKEDLMTFCKKQLAIRTMKPVLASAATLAEIIPKDQKDTERLKKMKSKLKIRPSTQQAYFNTVEVDRRRCTPDKSTSRRDQSSRLAKPAKTDQGSSHALRNILLQSFSATEMPSNLGMRLEGPP